MNLNGLSLFFFINCTLISLIGITQCAIIDSKSTPTSLNKLTDNLSNSVSHQECNLPQELVDEIGTYKPIVESIINASTNGIFKGRTWRTLAKFVDKFGSRIAGSDNLENAIDYMVDLLKKNQLDNVHTEPALVPKWVRGRESCWMVSPRLEKLNILGLGSSIGTPKKGISANAIVVSSFEELHKLGKQVLLLENFSSFGTISFLLI